MSHRHLPAAAVAVAAALLLAACGSGFDSASAPPTQQAGPAALNVLVAGDPADTDAVRNAAQKWATATGNTVAVNPANDMDQQLSQGFAVGNPPDLFMVDASRFASAGASPPRASTRNRPRTSSTR